jgi:hypothetical protein
MRTIAQISDLHFGRHIATVAEGLLASLSEQNPDLVVLSGDFTQRARHAEFAEARRFLERIVQPKLVIPGNHDVPLYNLFRRFMTPFAKYHHYVTPMGLPADLFIDEELAVLGLNTARRFDPPPLNWSTLKYVLRLTGGPKCLRSVISRKRSSPSYARSMSWSHRANQWPMRFAPSA